MSRIEEKDVGLADADLEIDAAAGGEADEIDAVGKVLLEEETYSGRDELVGDVRDDGEIVDLGEFLECLAVVGEGDSATELAQDLESFARHLTVGIGCEADAVVAVAEREARSGAVDGLNEVMGSERMEH
jgi:hypothetical protein